MQSVVLFQNNVRIYLEQRGRMMNKEDYENIYVLEGPEIEAQYEYIGGGSSRIVYAIDSEKVIKYADNDMGIRQNFTEWQIYNNADDKERQILAPVFGIGYGGRTLIMGRADTVNQGPDDLDYEYLERIIRDYDLLEEDILDPSSWGIYKDLLVCIDYGCTKEIRDEYDDTMLHDHD